MREMTQAHLEYLKKGIQRMTSYNESRFVVTEEEEQITSETAKLPSDAWLNELSELYKQIDSVTAENKALHERNGELQAMIHQLTNRTFIEKVRNLF